MITHSVVLHTQRPFRQRRRLKRQLMRTKWCARSFRRLLPSCATGGLNISCDRDKDDVIDPWNRNGRRSDTAEPDFI